MDGPSDLQPPRWAVWRQDDNGIAAEVSLHEEESDAIAVALALQARGHKQIYWVVEVR